MKTNLHIKLALLVLILVSQVFFIAGIASRYKTRQSLSAQRESLDRMNGYIKQQNECLRTNNFEGVYLLDAKIGEEYTNNFLKLRVSK